MQMASMISFLFSTYPIALIGKADTQEDAPFSFAPFISCCDSGSVQFLSYFITAISVFCILLLYSPFHVSGTFLV